MVRLSWLTWWAQSHLKGPYKEGPYKGRAEGSESERDKGKYEDAMMLVLRMKEKAMNQFGKSQEWTLL